MSDTTQSLPVIAADKLLKCMMSCAGMQNHFQEQGLELADYTVMSELVQDDTLVFFSIKRVIARQVYKTNKAKDYILDFDQDKVIRVINQALNKLPELKCDICGLNGHSNSSCWLNGQIYSTCRSSGSEFQEANFLWREALKLRRATKDECVRQACAAKRSAA